MFSTNVHYFTSWFDVSQVIVISTATYTTAAHEALRFLFYCNNFSVRIELMLRERSSFFLFHQWECLVDLDISGSCFSLTYVTVLFHFCVSGYCCSTLLTLVLSCCCCVFFQILLFSLT